MRPALISASLWALAFGLLETNYFSRENFVLPLTTGHFWLVLIAFFEYLILALIPVVALAWIARKGAGRTNDALEWSLPGWWLLLILAVSFYRTTVNPTPRTLEGTIWTFLVVGLMVILLWGLTRLDDRFPGLAKRLSVFGAITLSVVGLVGLLSTLRRSSAAVGSTEDAEQISSLDTCLDCPRVLLIGLDGGDWKVLDPMIERGELPAFERLVRNGVSARLKTVIPTSSPLLWTSIASGKSVAKHGIHDHTRTQLPLGLPPSPMQAKWFRTLTKPTRLALRYLQRVHPFTPLGLVSSQVEAIRIWEILDLFGLQSIVLDWYVSHPVTLQNGIQVSHRFHTKKGAVSETPGLVHPPELATSLEPEIVTPEELDDEIVWGLLDADDLDKAAREGLEQERQQWFKAIRWEMARDLTTKAVASAAFPLVPDWRFAGVYYRAMDISHHLAWQYMDLEKPEDPSVDSDWRFRKVVEQYYRYCDSLLAATLEQANENTVVIVLSDHGWENTLRAHDFAPDGFLIMTGKPVKSSSERLDIHIYDIVPTVLALLGLPVAEDMDGKVATQFVEDWFWKRHPISRVPSYQWESQAPVAGEEIELDEETKEHLRALGYLE